MCARWQSPLVTLINVKWLMLKEVKWWKSFTWDQPQLVFFKTKSLLRPRACSDHVFIASMLSVDSASVGPHQGAAETKNLWKAELSRAFLSSTKIYMAKSSCYCLIKLCSSFHTTHDWNNGYIKTGMYSYQNTVKSVRFKNTVERSSILSILWSFSI